MTVLVERRDNVGLMTLNRPEKRNALDRATTEAFGQHLAGLEEDPQIRSIVLTGSGDRAFCAGMDLTNVGQAKADPGAGSLRYMNFVESGASKPVIAAVNGAAVAGGFELALACDLIVAAEHA